MPEIEFRPAIVGPRTIVRIKLKSSPGDIINTTEIPIDIRKSTEEKDVANTPILKKLLLKRLESDQTAFEGSIRFTHDKEKYQGDIEVEPGDFISLAYIAEKPRVLSRNNQLGEVTRVFKIQSFDPVFKLDKNKYEIGDIVKVSITEPGENKDADAVDEFSVKVLSDSDREGCLIQLRETSPDSSQFQGEFNLSDRTSQNSIKVAKGGTVTIKYKSEIPADFTPRKKSGIRDLSKSFFMNISIGSYQDFLNLAANAQLAIERYIDPALLSKIKGGDSRSLNPTNKTVTIVFWDIRGFSRMCESLATKQELIMEFLEDYFGIAERTVSKYGGIIDKLMGDGIMALFGVFNDSTKTDADAKAAANAALEFRDSFNELVKIWTRQWSTIVPRKISISLRCGINTDDVIVGNIGKFGRAQFTAIGTAVNLASRFEGEANDERILVSSMTRNRIENEFETNYFKTIDDIKNIEGTFESFEIMGKKLESKPSIEDSIK